jgi:hypothetical protein
MENWRAFSFGPSEGSTHALEFHVPLAMYPSSVSHKT